jgi:DNA polymerase elongation subunit (family B)
MIINATDKNNMFLLRWRDDFGVRQEKQISYSQFNPYFYILASEQEKSFVMLSEFGQKFRVDLSYELDGSVSLDGSLLKKVTWNPPKPGYTRTLRNEWEHTFEADVPFHYRYAIDELKEIPEYDMLKWYWDLEWQQGGEHDGAITCISFYDSYDRAYNLYYWIPESSVISPHPIKGFDKNGTAYPLAMRFTTEHAMLVNFIGRIKRTDPDMLISWFGSKFDLPKLIERLHVNDIDPRKLSPINDVKGVYFNDGIKLSKAAQEYNPIDQPIRGRICLNLDLAFERQWNDAQKGTLPSMALDYISEIVLGEKKLVSEKFPDKNEFFARAWLEDTETYLQYAVKDVELLVRLDAENYTSEAILALQRLLIAPFDACFYASMMGGIYFMRNATWKAPTGKVGDKMAYQGAMIYDPTEEGTHGLHLGVAAFDFASLYPSMMIARNISWETKSDEPTEFGVNVLIPRDFSEVTEEDYKYYKTDKLGLLPQAVLELKELRDEYKENMKNAKTESEKMKWHTNQMAVKRLMASFYGVVGYQGFGWADIDLAASITASAREAIRCAAFKVMEL